MNRRIIYKWSISKDHNREMRIKRRTTVKEDNQKEKDRKWSISGGEQLLTKLESKGETVRKMEQ
jgi:hypothetical protein